MVTILEQVENPDLAKWCVRLVFCELLEGGDACVEDVVVCRSQSSFFGVSTVVSVCELSSG